jgi:hypothetical protein
MSFVLDGPVHWDLTRAQDGHRDYKIIWQLHTDNPDDGPNLAMNCPGMPAIGSTWRFGNDNDPWAYCWPNLAVAPVQQKEKCAIWTAEQLFTTRPFSRCAQNQIESPFLEPMRLGGTFTKLTKLGTHDRFGRRIQKPSFEPFTGNSVEFDDNRPTIEVGFNAMFLPLAVLAPLIDVVNDAPLWGLPARTIKVANARWSRAVYGTCSYYFPVDFSLEVNYNTWDRKLQNDCQKRLKTMERDGVTGDPDNPDDYVVNTDEKGNPCPCILNNDGTLWDGADPDNPPTTTVEYYDQNNLLTLGLPADLENC